MNAFLRSIQTGFIALFLTLFLTSCEAIGDIFGAGVWTGVILVVVGIAVVVWLVSKMFGGGRS